MCCIPLNDLYLSSLQLMHPNLVLISPVLLFLTAFQDLILRVFITHIMALPSISNVCASTNSLDLLVFCYVLLPTTVVCVHWCTCCIWVQTLLYLNECVSVNMPSRCPVPFIICSLRCCSAIIGVFWVCLVLCVINLPILSTTLCTTTCCGLHCCPLQLCHAFTVHNLHFVWLVQILQ